MYENINMKEIILCARLYFILMLNTLKAMGEGNYFYLYPFGDLVHRSSI
jgi:hypothetical protein